jgi:hypothetical protein
MSVNEKIEVCLQCGAETGEHVWTLHQPEQYRPILERFGINSALTPSQRVQVERELMAVERHEEVVDLLHQVLQSL